MVGISDLDAMRYIEHVAPTPVLLQFAEYEQYFKKEAAGRYALAAREPKQVRWYRTDHELNDPQCLRDRLAWLTDRIGLSRGIEP